MEIFTIFLDWMTNRFNIIPMNISSNFLKIEMDKLIYMEMQSTDNNKNKRKKNKLGKLKRTDINSYYKLLQSRQYGNGIKIDK